jgi:hypothetical protein
MGITLEQLNRATLATQGELANHGFWEEKSRLLKIDVIWCRYPSPATFDSWATFFHGDDRLGRLLGYAKGHIYIPSWSILHFRPKTKATLRDIVRHEYAHGIAHYYPGLIQKAGRFKEVFGGNYWAKSHSRSEHDEFVSEYASTMPMEDFAETFMVYLRHRGELPARFAIPAIRRKWSFIRDLSKAVRSGRLSW